MSFILTPKLKKEVDDWYYGLSEEERDKVDKDLNEGIKTMLKENPHIKVIMNEMKQNSEKCTKGINEAYDAISETLGQKPQGGESCKCKNCTSQEIVFIPESFKFRPLDKCEDNVIKNIDIVVNLKDTDLDEKELIKLVEKKLKEISMNIDDWYLHDTDKRTTIKRKENA